MPYCTQAEVQTSAGGADKLKQLSDYTGAGAINSAEVASAIEEADAKIDMYVGKRFKTAIANGDGDVPDSIKWSSARIAVLVLRRRRRGLTQVDLQLMEAEMRMLEGLAEGDLIPTRTDKQAEKSPLVVDAQHQQDDVCESTRNNLRGFW